MDRRITLVITLVVSFVFLSLNGGRAFAACSKINETCETSHPAGQRCCSGLVCKASPISGTFTCQKGSLLGEVPQPYGSGYGAAGLGSFLNNVISATLTGAGLLLFLYLVYGGIMYMTASGDEKAVDKARKTLTNALIGLVIIATSYFIARILETILGIDILKPTFTGP